MLLRAAGSAGTGRQVTQYHTLDRSHVRNVRMRAKMYVPSDSFGGISPEKKASQALQSLFTFISAKIVLAQLEGSGRGALAAYNQEQYTVLFSHLQEVSLSDPHKWLEQLMRKDKALAMRLMEVRDAYSNTDFEWDQLQQLSVEALKKSNLQLMRQAAAASLQASVAAEQPQAVLAAEQEQQQKFQAQGAVGSTAEEGIRSEATTAAGCEASDNDSNRTSRGESSDNNQAPAPESISGPDRQVQDSSRASQQEQQ